MKKSIGAVLGVALLSIVFLGIRILTPKRMAANVLIQETGRYASPDGECFVDVWEENEGEIKFYFYRQKNEGWSGGGSSELFQAKSDWFMCWDSQDRLWTYVPEQDQHRCSCWYANAEVNGICKAGNLGGWEGIPPSFFARLPGNVKATYEAYIRKKQSTNSEQDAESDGEDAAG